METDTKNQAIVSFLSQYHLVNGCKQHYRVVYYANSRSATQRNWPIHDQQLFAIVDCLQKWRDWLIGVSANVYTDHQGLQYVSTKEKMNPRYRS